MRILYVADGRSPIAQNWIRHFVNRGDEVSIASTFACSPDFPVKELQVIPVAFSGLRNATQRPGTAPARTVGLRTALRQWFGPLTIRRAAQKLREYTERLKPDLVHAMRIPYEGMLAADAYSGIPLIVSVWGNDFTFHGNSTRLMKHYSKWTMKVADGLHADCHRDVRLAREWGFGLDRPSLVAPGNGGIRSGLFFPPQHPVEDPIVIHPRGFRPYVRNDVYFKAIPHVLAKHPKARFLFALMAGELQAEEWIRELGIGQAVELLPPLPNSQMADVFRRAQVVASPSIHDGTPNSLLEGMACGCFPVAGDLESIREWITPGRNGLLFDPNDEHSIASAICTALEERTLREQAADVNRDIIATRAEYELNMKRAEGFYERVIQSTNQDGRSRH